MIDHTQLCWVIFAKTGKVPSAIIGGKGSPCNKQYLSVCSDDFFPHIYIQANLHLDHKT